MRADRSFNSR